MITSVIHGKDEGFRFHHNGDFSGDVIINVEAHNIEDSVGTTKMVTIPFDVLRNFVHQYQRYKMMQEIEDMSDDEFDNYQTMQCRNAD